MKSEVSGLDRILHEVESRIERAAIFGLVENQETRYEVIGELGELILDAVDTITPLPEGSRLW